MPNRSLSSPSQLRLPHHTPTIPKVNIIPVSDINTYELIDNKKLVVTADALKYIEEVLA